MVFKRENIRLVGGLGDGSFYGDWLGRARGAAATAPAPAGAGVFAGGFDLLLS